MWVSAAHHWMAYSDVTKGFLPRNPVILLSYRHHAWWLAVKFWPLVDTGSVVNCFIYALFDTNCSLSLWSVSQGCIPSTSSRHAGLSIARRLAITRLKLSGCRSSSTVLSQVCFGLPVLLRQSLGGRRMQARRAREWSWPMSAWHRWPKKDKCHWRIVSDRSGCPVCDRTTSLKTKSIQWIWRMHLRHQLSSASIFFSRVEVSTN